jgi:1,4-dihydroxy-2-naphthoyl-CoA synthase
MDGTQDMRKGTNAFLEKRKPAFKGLKRVDGGSPSEVNLTF